MGACHREQSCVFMMSKDTALDLISYSSRSYQLICAVGHRSPYSYDTIGGTDNFSLPREHGWNQDERLTALLAACGSTGNHKGHRHMVSIRCLSPANTNHLFKQLRYLLENKRSASILPRQSDMFSWLQDKFREFCPTMACGLVFSFIFATCEGAANRLLRKKKN